MSNPLARMMKDERRRMKATPEEVARDEARARDANVFWGTDGITKDRLEILLKRSVARAVEVRDIEAGKITVEVGSALPPGDT